MKNFNQYLSEGKKKKRTVKQKQKRRDRGQGTPFDPAQKEKDIEAAKFTDPSTIPLYRQNPSASLPELQVGDDESRRTNYGYKPKKIQYLSQAGKDLYRAIRFHEIPNIYPSKYDTARGDEESYLYRIDKLIYAVENPIEFDVIIDTAETFGFKVPQIVYDAFKQLAPQRNYDYQKYMKGSQKGRGRGKGVRRPQSPGDKVLYDALSDHAVFGPKHSQNTEKIYEIGDGKRLYNNAIKNIVNRADSPEQKQQLAQELKSLFS